MWALISKLNVGLNGEEGDRLAPSPPQPPYSPPYHRPQVHLYHPRYNDAWYSSLHSWYSSLRSWYCNLHSW